MAPFSTATIYHVSIEAHVMSKTHNNPPLLNCWFCLGNKDVETHLCTYVGKEVYVALAKGFLTPYHIIIIPIAHCGSIINLSDEVIQEINEIKQFLVKFFKTLNLRCVFYERNFKTPHFQIHCLQVSTDKYHQIKPLFLTLAKQYKIKLNEIPSLTELRQVITPSSRYFYVELDTREKLFANILSDFPINFGREVFCHSSLLNLPNHVDWKAFKIDNEEEENAVSNLRAIFQNAMKC